MTEDDLKAIEARYNAATEGPWPDPALCARSRQDIPALIAEVRRLRERLERPHWAAGQP